MNKTFILLIALSLYVQNLKSQTWNYVGSAQFAQGAESDIEVYNGEVYVAFRDLSNNSKCTVMKFDGSNWVAVGNAGFTPDKIVNDPSIAISSVGEIYVAFKDYDKFNRASLMKFDGSTWNYVGLAGFSNATADYIDLTLKQDTPIVAYQRNNKGVVVRKFNGSGYDFLGDQLNISYGDANYIDIEVGNNEIFVAHRNILAFTQYATVRKWDGNTWADEANPNFSAGDMSFTTLTIDKATNTPYVAYKDRSSGNFGKLVVMKSDGNTWQNVGNPTDTVIGSVDDMEIRFFNGQPYLAFLEYQGSNKANVITYNGSEWTYLGSKGFSPNFSDELKMTIDETNGKIYVVFYEGGYISVMTYDLGVLNIEEVQNQPNITFFPNPATDKLTIQAEERIEKIEIYDFLGHKVSTVNQTKGKVEEINIDDYKEGTYLVKVSTPKGIKIFTFIKQ